MIPAFVIGFRETLEAALIIGILLVYLKKIGKTSLYRYVYTGCLTGLAASLAFGLIPGLLNSLFANIDENIFNAAILYSAVAVMTSVILWMRSNAKKLKTEIEQKTDDAVETGKIFGLALLSFFGVFREGVETVLFMWSIVVSGNDASILSRTLTGCFIGILTAVLFSWAFFNRFMGSFNIKKFFQVTTVLIVIISAGMFAKASGKLAKAGVISPIVKQVWDSSWLLNEKPSSEPEEGFGGNIKVIFSSVTSGVISGLTGYKSKPSLLEVLTYFGYIGVIAVIFNKEKLVCLCARESKTSKSIA